MRTIRSVAAALAFAAVVLAALGVAERASAAGAAIPGTHIFGVSAIEIKGATTTDKLPPPPVNPSELSKGYGYKAPGEADKNAPQRWEVSSYLFSPDFLVVRQGDQVSLRVFVVNGDEHETHVTDPDGKLVVPHAVWNRGRQYTASFVAEKAGLYELGCTTHTPTMYTKILALPH